MQAPAYLIEKLKTMKTNWKDEFSPEEALQIMFASYGLKSA